MVTYQALYAERIQQEVAAMPDEYLPLLLDMIQVFRQSVVLKPAADSLREGLQEVLRNETLPVSELWVGIDSDEPAH